MRIIYSFVIATTIATLCLVSCSSPKDTAKSLMTDFSNDLKKIKNPKEMSVYELDKEISKYLKKALDRKEEELAKLSEEENISLFDKNCNLYEVTKYKKMIEILTQKNKQILQNIKNDYWIESNKKDIHSIFEINNNTIRFLNLKNKFHYEISNGNIICDNQKVFLELKSNHLLITYKSGDKQKFEKATLQDMIIGRWTLRNGGKGTYSFKRNGKGVYDSYVLIPLTYSINGNKIKTIETYKGWKDVYINTYLSSDKIKHQKGAIFYRLKVNKADVISYLVSGCYYENPNKNEVQNKYSNTNNSHKGSKDWDKLLDDYEEYINQCVKIAKKMQNGDMDVMTDYADLLEKAKEFQQNLEKAKKNNFLSSSQIRRMLKIQNKMINSLK